MKAPIIKSLFVIVIATGLIISCTNKNPDQQSQDHTTHDSTENNTGNQALYDQVMKVHNEVMPKMDDILKIKEVLKEKLNTQKELADEKKKEIEAVVSKLDSANQRMMNWMHEFKTQPDSLGEEKIREYLETEMERIKKVSDEMKDALEKANALK